MTGVSVACVALFPSRTGLPQFLVATVTVVGMGVSALLAAIRGWFGYVPAILGSLEPVRFVPFVALAVLGGRLRGPPLLPGPFLASRFSGTAASSLRGRNPVIPACESVPRGLQ